MGLHGTTTNGVVTGFSVISDMGAGGVCDKSVELGLLGLNEEDIPEPEDRPEPEIFPETEEEEVEEKEEDQDCQCLSDNDIDQTKRNGQKVIIMTDENGLEHEYPAAYGTACIGWDEILPPFCGDGNDRPLDD